MTAVQETRFDALIVGAGLAGSATAIELARAGWSVALVERQPFPRRKVCGECISASNLPLLQALGIGDVFDACAGPELRRVSLLCGERHISADLPEASHEHFVWGQALGRETLDCLLLDKARDVGASVFQPWSVQTISGSPGAWRCELRARESAALLRLRAKLVIDAHGSWEDLPVDRPRNRRAHRHSDLFAFKANFIHTSLPAHEISVLALNGGYGGMVLADRGRTTVACCIRRDQLTKIREQAPGRSVGNAVETWLQQECAGLRRALQGAVRDGPWLTCGPLDPGVRVAASNSHFRIGNAAGEAHPILGEGMSMALQSASMLCTCLLGPTGNAAAPDGAAQTDLQRRYAGEWRKAFTPRLRLAALFAHVAMRPRGAEALLNLTQRWPELLTRGARWGGKVCFIDPVRHWGTRTAPPTQEASRTAIPMP